MDGIFEPAASPRRYCVFQFWRGTLLRVKGNVTTEIGERYYGLRPPGFPTSFRIFGHLPAHGGKLGTEPCGPSDGASSWPQRSRVVRPNVTGKGIQFHAAGFAGIDPAA